MTKQRYQLSLHQVIDDKLSPAGIRAMVTVEPDTAPAVIGVEIGRAAEDIIELFLKGVDFDPA
ncbi:MAG: hypothetical protein V3W44_09800 [Dehalococcoidales bacterium]